MSSCLSGLCSNRHDYEKRWHLAAPPSAPVADGLAGYAALQCRPWRGRSVSGEEVAMTCRPGRARRLRYWPKAEWQIRSMRGRKPAVRSAFSNGPNSTHTGHPNRYRQTAREDPCAPQSIFRPLRQAMTSSSPRTASSIGITGLAWNSKAGSMEQNLCTVTGSSQSAIK